MTMKAPARSLPKASARPLARKRTAPTAPAVRLDPRGGAGLPAQIRHWVADRIRRGELRPGDRVPSERELAAACRVSRMTARQALLDLDREGLLRRQVGQGTFVADRAAPRPGVRSLALVLSLHPESRHSTAVFQQAALARDHNTLYFDLDGTRQDPEEEARILDRCVEAGVSGIALFPTPRADNGRLYDAIRARGIKVILFLPTPYWLDRQSWVFCDHVEAGRLGTLHLLDAGYRRVLFAGMDEPLNSVAHRLRIGWRQALTERGFPEAGARELRLDPVFSVAEPSRAAWTAVFGGPPEPGTAIFAGTALKARKVQAGLAAFGLRPPDIGLLTFEEASELQSFSFVGGTAEETMRLCAEILAGEGPADMLVQRHLAPRVFQGATTRPVGP